MDFDRAFQAERSHLLAFARHRTRDKDLAEDLVQTTALKAYRSREDYDRSRSFRNWLCSILTRVHLDHVRRTGRRPPEVLDCDRPDELATLDHLVLVEDAHFAGSIPPRLFKAINALSEKTRRAFVLIDVLEVGGEEAAGIAGCNVQAMRARALRGRDEIRRKLGGPGIMARRRRRCR